MNAKSSAESPVTIAAFPRSSYKRLNCMGFDKKTEEKFRQGGGGKGERHTGTQMTMRGKGAVLLVMNASSKPIMK